MKSEILSVFVVFFVIFCVTEISSQCISVQGDDEYLEAYKLPRVCRLGLRAYLPDIITKPPIACNDPNEVYACGYSEGRCDNRGFCGTPPCTWRCWCKIPYRRDANGRCVLNCPFKADISVQTSPL